MKHRFRTDRLNAGPVTIGSPPKSLVWADTGEPVKGGDLTKGEFFKVELDTGKTERLRKQNND